MVRFSAEKVYLELRARVEMVSGRLYFRMVKVTVCQFFPFRFCKVYGHLNAGTKQTRKHPLQLTVLDLFRDSG